MKLKKTAYELQIVRNEMANLNTQLEVQKNILDISAEFTKVYESNVNAMSNRNVSPQVTNKKEILELGVSLTGIKQVFVSLGFMNNEITDALDLLTKDGLHNLKYSNGNKSSFIDIKRTTRIVTSLSKILINGNGIHNANNSHEVSNRAMFVIYSLIGDKIRYIEDNARKENIINRVKCIDIIKKYDLYGGLYYGIQQYNISKEISNIVGKQLSFSECLRTLRVSYDWQSYEPYFCSNGRDWLTCRVAI